VVLVAVVAGWRARARLAPGVRALPLVAVSALGSALIAATLGRNGDYRSAVAIWQSVVAVVPDNRRAFGNLGGALIAEGRLDEAIAALEKTLAIGRRDLGFVDPFIDYLAYSNLGFAELQSGRPEAARQALDAALEIHTRHRMTHWKSGAVYLSLGDAFLERGESERALECYQRAVAIEPSAMAQRVLADALHRGGAHAAAESHYRAALELEPDSAELHLGLADALSAQQKKAEALEQYAAAVRLAPELQEARTNLGVQLSVLGRFDQALEHFRRALAIPPDDALEHYNLGRCLVETGQAEEALVHFREASRLDETLVEPLHAAAKLLVARERSTEEERREALQLAERAAALNQHPLVLETLALACAACGNPERAARTLETALGSTSDDELRARLRKRLEDVRRAAGER